MSTYDQAKSRHANTARLQIDGLDIADLMGVTVRESGGTSPVHVVGTVYPIEHLHDRYSVSVSVNAAVFKDSALEFRSVGQANLTELPTCTIVAYDDVAGAEITLFQVDGCTQTDRSLSINANQRLARDLQFVGLAMNSDITDATTQDPDIAR